MVAEGLEVFVAFVLWVWVDDVLEVCTLIDLASTDLVSAVLVCCFVAVELGDDDDGRIASSSTSAALRFLPPPVMTAFSGAASVAVVVVVVAAFAVLPRATRAIVYWYCRIWINKDIIALFLLLLLFMDSD